MITISSHQSQIQINPQGCTIPQLILKDQPIFWSGTRPDGKLSATHPCIPNFGQVNRGVLQKIPQHGPARHQLWRLTSQTINTAEFKWIMTGITGVYPAGLTAMRNFKITSDAATITTKITNTGKEPISINPGEHCYFICKATQLAKVKINATSINPNNLPNTEYMQVDNDLTINLPNIDTITMQLIGYHHIALWTQKNAKFICTEPIASLPDDIYLPQNQLKSNENRVFGIKISI